VVVGTNSQITAKSARLKAGYSFISSDQKGSASGGGLFGGSSATADGTIKPNAQVLLKGDGNSNTRISGFDGVDVGAGNGSIGISFNLDSSFIGIGGSDTPFNTQITPNSYVEGDTGVTILAGPRIRPGAGVPPGDATPLSNPAGFDSLALYVQSYSPN